MQHVYTTLTLTLTRIAMHITNNMFAHCAESKTRDRGTVCLRWLELEILSSARRA